MPNPVFKKPKIAIFDLGNVVIRIDWQPMFHIWCRASGVPANVLQQRFQFDGAYEAFERGQLTAGEYHESVCLSLGAEIPYPDFFRGWDAIFQGELEGIGAMLGRIKDKVQVAAFTNTNEVHRLEWQKQYEEVLSHFHHIFISSEMGIRKPEPEGFEHILSHFSTEPGDAVFFDDLMESVEAARRLGIQAVLVESAESVRSVLVASGLLE